MNMVLTDDYLGIVCFFLTCLLDFDVGISAASVISMACARSRR